MTSSTMSVVVTRTEAFDEDRVKDTIAAVAGVSSEQVSVRREFSATVSYDVPTGATAPTMEEVRNAVAAANGISPEYVVVTQAGGGRRLDEAVASRAAVRQLSTTSTYDVTIIDPPPTISSQDAAEMTTALSANLPGLQVVAEPVETLEVTITYPSSDTSAAAAVSTVTSQSAVDLTTTLSAASPGITVVSAPVITATTDTVSVLVLAPSPPPPSPPPPLPPPTPPPMCECDVVHGAASLFDPCLKIEAGLRHCYPSAGGCPSDMTDCISVYDCKNKMSNKKCNKKKDKGLCDLSSAKCTKKTGKCRKVRRKCKLSCNNC